jgi:putative phosphoesterase
MKVLILSDVHGNWPALRAVLEAESDANRILCLGDLVNFGPQPAECVAWAKELVPPAWVIQGNHDRAVAFNEDPLCSSAYAPLAAATQPVSEKSLAPELREFLAELQPSHRFEWKSAKCFACHAIPSEPLYGYLPETASATLWSAELVAAGLPDFLFLGHTHVPMKTRLMKTLIVNPGSVGLPQHGNPQAAYAVWEDGEVTMRRVAYDVEETIRAYGELGIPPELLGQLTEMLRTGKGPSLKHSDDVVKRTAVKGNEP